MTSYDIRYNMALIIEDYDKLVIIFESFNLKLN